MDMRVNIAGVEWKNPVTVASGTFGSGAEFCDFVDLSKLGAVTYSVLLRKSEIFSALRMISINSTFPFSYMYLIRFFMLSY